MGKLTDNQVSLLLKDSLKCLFEYQRLMGNKIPSVLLASHDSLFTFKLNIFGKRSEFVLLGKCKTFSDLGKDYISNRLS
jgi:hypothetical protein